MKKIESFEELRQLPFGSIVCMVDTTSSAKTRNSFAMVNHCFADILCGCINLFDQEQKLLYGKNGVGCSFIVSPNESIGCVIFEDSDFNSQNLYLFEAADIAELWQSLMHVLVSPENTCNDTVKALLFGVIQFHPRSGDLSCYCMSREKFAQFNAAKDPEKEKNG